MNIKQSIITAAVALTMVAMAAPMTAGAVTAMPIACTGVTFSRNLRVGMTGQDVQCLQVVLNMSATTQVSLTGPGSPTHETIFFGLRTLSAIRKWQQVQGFTPATQLGPLSRARLAVWLNQQSGASSTAPAAGATASQSSPSTPAYFSFLHNNSALLTQTPVLSSTKAITVFNFNALSPTVTGTVNENNHTVSLTVPFGTSVTALVPTITTTGTSLSPATAVAQNFTSPVTYTVTAQNGTTQDYVVTVTIAPNTATQITSFNFTSPSVTGTVNNTNHTVALTVPFGTTVTSLTPTIVVSTGATISPTSGTARNFTSPQTYTVTAQDTVTTQTYTVTVTVLPNPAKAITAFNFNGLSPAVTGAVTEGSHTIALTVPYGTPVTALVPTITITGASVSPNTGVAQNFTSPQTYTVTAADSTTQAYVVTVTVSAQTYPITLINTPTWSSSIPSVLSGVNSVTLNGTNQYGMASGSGLPYSNQSFSVSWWQKTSSSSGGDFYAWAWGGNGAGAPIEGGMYQNKLFVYNAGSLLIQSVALVNDGAWHHGTVTYNGTIVRLYLDGTQVATSTITLTTIVGGNLFVGSPTSQSSRFPGSLTGIRVYGNTLSVGDVTTLSAGGNPSSVPLRQYNFSEGTGITVADSGVSTAANPQVICDGNSLTSGTGSSNSLTMSYPGQLSTLLSTWAVSNFGVGGQTTEAMNSDAVTQIDSLYDASRPKNIVVAWEGINSINNANDTAAQAYAAMTTYIQGRKAAGFKVIVLTTMKWGTISGANETIRQAYNALIIANSAGADAVVDVASDSHLTDPTNTTYFNGDTVHLTDAGYAIVAGLVQPVVLAQ